MENRHADKPNYNEKKEEETMNEKEFYSKHIRPYLTNDRPRNREFYADTLDMFHRDGLITDKQAQNWSYPANNFFLAKSERRVIKRWKRCPACGGSGNVDASAGFPLDCEVCGGTGWVK